MSAEPHLPPYQSLTIMNAHPHWFPRPLPSIKMRSPQDSELPAPPPRAFDTHNGMRSLRPTQTSRSNADRSRGGGLRSMG